ncbi:unnamed protein product [Acanthoscelides obtectus]|uniref:Uncharacterized protein n=1 Tax=Acanthoscelides obtectus TaxID=200917 RepID=A0A9P0LN99_ACAOB|nr:unnamed protein product [Acanthoscelides obtectus]CAK1669477.1 hypothetical protein AOBTE_LOCUS27024 [Acanthoscelides obtectus]
MQKISHSSKGCFDETDDIPLSLLKESFIKNGNNVSSSPSHQSKTPKINIISNILCINKPDPKTDIDDIPMRLDDSDDSRLDQNFVIDCKGF